MTRYLRLLALPLAGILLSASVAGASELDALTTIKSDVRSRRVGSFDQTGGNADFVKGVPDGGRVTLMDVKGAGVIRHIWITLAPGAADLNRNEIILRMFWDGNEYPSVESPLGPFFGNGWGESYNVVTAPLSVSPGWGKSYVSYFAMPFAKGARIELENQTGRAIDNVYFNIDYDEVKQLPAEAGRFHAWYNHQITEAAPDGENEWALLGEPAKNKEGARNYVFADIKGRGHLVGVNYYINSPTPMWYGEGDEMIFIDGEALPSLNGTGTEDYFNTSWCPKEIFIHPYYGYPRVNGETGWLGRTHVYRFHITDPMYFQSSCRYTIEHGHANNLTLDLASVAYWYQDTAARLPRSFTKEERKHLPAITHQDMHLWRDAWRKSRDNAPKLWGNERKK